jgi:hypothetical protein
MPKPVMSEPVMIVLIIVAGLIIGLAIWVGRGLVLRRNKKGLVFEVKEKRKEQQPKGENIKVAEELKLTDVTAGDIAGKVVEGGDSKATEANSIEVANKGNFKNAKLGDIVGVKQVNRDTRGK